MAHTSRFLLCARQGPKCAAFLLMRSPNTLNKLYSSPFFSEELAQLNGAEKVEVWEGLEEGSNSPKHGHRWTGGCQQETPVPLATEGGAQREFCRGCRL